MSTLARRKLTSAPDATRLLKLIRERRTDLTESIREFVELESPSDHKASVDRLGELLATRFETLGGRPTFHRQHEFGDHLQITFSGETGRPVLLLGHFDTVWELGSLQKMPWRVRQGRLWGPGVLDMKSGIALMLHAIVALRELRKRLPRPVTVLLNTDEEVGSSSSRKIIESLARKSSAVLVLEPAQGSHGAVKTARKGVGDYSLKVIGRAAHAGVDFGSGLSAILELAKQIIRISQFTHAKPGLTVNVGVIRGGTRTNVIAAEAVAEIDIRIARKNDAAFVEKKMRALRPFSRECRLELSGGINRPPMERTPGVAALFGTASKIALQLDWKLEEAATGGGSDGNFTSALGIPTLDGLGAVGEGAHASHESVVIDELPRRAALLASLIEAV